MQQMVMGVMGVMDLIVVMVETEEMQEPTVMETAGMVVREVITGEMGDEGEMEMVLEMVVAVVMLDGEGEVEDQVVEVALAAKMVLPVRVRPDKRRLIPANYPFH
ncbi:MULTISPECIES: hypothetical protein [Yersinia pseudotuberculosis complex]|uniref:Uncharacterized protein n=3 Tax=Yersinia pestis TaxID=632 RepID=A0A0E1NRV5_YERPA|nr:MULTISPECIES: hypothetical protein [Yersinia pseudotuberculosis complex]ABG13067.1 hypothetical protein YPA_1100 [Yersinia pestis Antiqua]ABG19136.1 hypothetical protein YPN_2809 [Yersinia pestis Nepal516]ACY57946.1 hypothetical protein YPD4_1037 [Yersinia pestis D106004]AJK13185.1 hypothetical protein CH60_2577 [Yersinia pestis str. Pestoides B]AKS85983.1 hypothetical protein M477_63 [Yersinia pestis 790]EDR51489.1 conserved hypothetical protein [Yersinia pestis biovar Antiqua str. B42003